MNLVGKLSYLAPEIMLQLKNRQEDPSITEFDYDLELADVYSLGIMLGSIATLDKFDARDSPEDRASKMAKLQERSPGMYRLVVEMLFDDPEKRSSFADLAKNIHKINPEHKNITFFELEFESGLQNTREVR